MDYPIVVFMDNETTYRVLLPDFDALTFTCNSLDDAFDNAKKIIEEEIIKLKANGQNIPLASEREQYVTRYLDAVLVNKVKVDALPINSNQP